MLIQSTNASMLPFVPRASRVVAAPAKKLQRNAIVHGVRENQQRRKVSLSCRHRQSTITELGHNTKETLSKAVKKCLQDR